MLLKTKFNIPFSGSKLLKRNRLTQKLDKYEEYNLILLTAPAGYGKTALISSWMKEEKNKKMTWLSLDEEDNDEELFWSYFLLSFYKNDWIPKEMRDRAEAMFGNTVPFNKLYLTYFINDVVRLGLQIIMVLDDFGVIQNERILQHMKFLINYTPSNMHLVLSGRGHSETGLARITALGSVLILDREELCFTQEETVSFFRSTAENRLPYETCVKVCNAFEGWAAGMQMMALSVHEDRELKFPLSVKEHLISSYIKEEVICGLNADLQKFLMETSVFEQFCPALCDFLFDKKNSRQMIRKLEHLNIFIVCLDRQEEWFRYHSLFREILKNMYFETHGKAEPLLYRKAAEWYAAKEYGKEAITYAVKGEDFETAVLLIEEFGREIGYKGEAGILHKWNQQLPESVVKNHPRLLLNSAWAYAEKGKLPEMLQCVQELKKTTALPTLLCAEVTALCSSNLSGPEPELEAMLTECRQALQILPPASFLAQLICFNMGGILLLKGCVEESLHYFEQCYRKSLETGEIYLTVTSGKAIMTSKIRHGQLREAEQEILALLHSSAKLGGDILPVMGLLYAELADIYYQRNELEEALKAAAEGSRLSEMGENVWSAEENYLMLERIYLAMNDRKGYERIKEKASLGLESRHPFDITLKMECHHAQILIEEGKLTSAFREISHIDKMIGTRLMMVYPEATLVKARFYIKKGMPEKSIELLHPLRTAAHTNGQKGLLCEVLVLLATIYDKMGNHIYALKELELAVDLAEEQDRIRIFLQEAALMPGMLKRLIDKKKAERTAYTFTELLLDCFQIQYGGNKAQTEELLSTREREILKLVIQGADNAEIAAALYISLNTVKTHLLHIYTKLGVHNRQKAATKAAALTII